MVNKITSAKTPLEQVGVINGIIDEIQPATSSSTGVVQPDNVSIIVEDGVITSLAGTPPDQTYDGTSIKAQSGVAIEGALSSTTSSITSSYQTYVNNKFQVVSALPANPDSNTFYFIPE